MSPLERHRAVFNSQLTTHQKMVVLAIVDHLSDDNGKAWPSLDRIADMTGMGRRSVTRNVASLESAGVLAVHRCATESSRYTVNWSALSRVARVATVARESRVARVATGGWPESPPPVARVATEVDQGSGPREVDHPTPPARERKAPKPKAPQVDVKPYTDAWAAAYLASEGKPYVWSKPFHRERAVFKKIAAQWPDSADASAAIEAYLGDIKGWRAKGLTPQPPTTQAFASKMATYAQVRAPKRKATSADEAWTALRRKIDGRNGYALASPPRRDAAILWRVVKAPAVDDRVWAAVEAVGGWASVVDANEDTRAAWMAAFGGELGAR